MSAQLADAVIAAGEMLLAFARVPRITFHPDGERPETDGDHTVMLSTLACSLAQYEPSLAGQTGLIAEFATVHDLVEVYAGDTNTLVGYDEAARAAKKAREHDALQRLHEEFDAALPWITARIDQYERQDTRAARYVKGLDKALPKITHALNNLATLRAQGMTREALARRYAEQSVELAAWAKEFPLTWAVREALVARMMLLAETALPSEDDMVHEAKETVA